MSLFITDNTTKLGDASFNHKVTLNTNDKELLLETSTRILSAILSSNEVTEMFLDDNDVKDGPISKPLCKVSIQFAKELIKQVYEERS